MEGRDSRSGSGDSTDRAGSDSRNSTGYSPVTSVVPWIWRNARKVVIGVIGGTVILVGLALLVLPGPGLVVIVLGLAILATEFAFAARWLRHTKERAKMATEYAQRQAMGNADETERQRAVRQLSLVRWGLRELEWATTLLMLALLVPWLLVFLANTIGFSLGGAFMRGGIGYYAAMGTAIAAGILHIMGSLSIVAGIRTRGAAMGIARAFLVPTAVIFAAALGIGLYASALLTGLDDPTQLAVSAGLQVNAFAFLLCLGALLSHMARGDDDFGGASFSATARNLGIYAVLVVILYWWPRVMGQRLLPIHIPGWGELLFAIAYVFYFGSLVRARLAIQARLSRITRRDDLSGASASAPPGL